MIDLRPPGATAASEAIFGSAARGDSDVLSDRDMLIVDDDVSVLRSRAAELAGAGWSVASYTFAKFDALCARGALFVQHLKLESTIIVDRENRLARKLGSFQPRRSYAEEICDNGKLASLAACVPHGPRGLLLGADILYVTVRNFGVLTLAERGIHIYSFDSVVEGLESEALIVPGGARALSALRFLKCLYRSGESGRGAHIRSTIEDAVRALPGAHFPPEVRAVSPNRIVHAPVPPHSMPAYFHLRDLERRLVALDAMNCSHAQAADLQLLSRWIANPRAYAALSARLAPDLRKIITQLASFPKLAAQ